MKNRKSRNQQANKERSPVKNRGDRHLDIPSEANRDKHINFTALENNDEDPSDQPPSGKLSGEKTNRH